MVHRHHRLGRGGPGSIATVKRCDGPSTGPSHTNRVRMRGDSRKLGKRKKQQDCMHLCPTIRICHVPTLGKSRLRNSRFFFQVVHLRAAHAMLNSARYTWRSESRRADRWKASP
jgi:hypothetical protein